MTNTISVLGNLRVAGALTLDANLPDFPANPKLGTFATVGLDIYLYTTLSGVNAWYPVIKQDATLATYVHNQVTPNANWTVAHNLNTPLSEIWYQVQDLLKNFLSPATIEEVDGNSFIIHFNAAESGACLVVGTGSLLLGSESIGDGTGVTKIHNYATQRLNFVAGANTIIDFDDNTKTITISTTGGGVGGVSQAALDAEVTRAMAVEATNAAAITAETTARTTAVSSVVTAINNEVARAESAETTINNALATKAELLGSTTTDFNVKAMNVYGDIMPDTASIRNIGSLAKPFSKAYINEVYLSTNTLYLGGTAVLGTDANVINVKADPGQSINVATTGLGQTLLSSEKGIDAIVSGAGGEVRFQSAGVGGLISFLANQSISFTAPTTTLYGDSSVTGSSYVGGNLTVTGNITVNGTSSIINSQTLSTVDNMIEVNRGQVGTGVSAGLAGISVNRGDGASYQMVFDESVQLFKVGMVGQLQVIASQNYVIAATANLAPLNGTGATGTWGISISGNAATVTTNANLTGDITSVGNATTLSDAVVTGKALTGFSSAAGVVSATDSVLSAINKLDGNVKAIGGTNINTQSAAGYTSVLADAQYANNTGALVVMNSASAQTLTIPPNSAVAYPLGATLQIAQYGAGKVTIAGGVGVTINSAGGLKSINGQYAAVVAIQVSANSWLLMGSLIA